MSNTINRRDLLQLCVAAPFAMGVNAYALDEPDPNIWLKIEVHPDFPWMTYEEWGDHYYGTLTFGLKDTEIETLRLWKPNKPQYENYCRAYAQTVKMLHREGILK